MSPTDSCEVYENLEIIIPSGLDEVVSGVWSTHLQLSRRLCYALVIRNCKHVVGVQAMGETVNDLTVL